MGRNRTIFYIAALLTVASLAVGPAEAARREPSPLKPKKDLRIEPRPFILAPYLTGGILVGGKVPELIPDRGRRALFGLGVRFEHAVRPFVRIGVSGEVLWAKVAESDSGRGRALMAAVSGMFLMHPSRPGSFYGRAQFGLVSVNATHFDNGGLGTYPYLRGGLGHQLFSSPTVATRVELYYETALSKGSDLDSRFFKGTIPVNAQAVGLELSVAFGL